MALPTQFVFAELLAQILENSATRSLIQYRLVCQHWKTVATQILLKRRSLKIKFMLHQQQLSKINNPTFCAFNWRAETLCYEHFGRKLKTDFRWTLPSFFRLVTTATCWSGSSLPVAHFDFSFQSCALNRNSPQLNSLLQVYGLKIRALTLENCIDYFVGHAGMPNFILQYTPNLELLVIAEGTPSVSNYPEITPAYPGKTVRVTQLAHLKRIEIHEPFSCRCCSRPQPLRERSREQTLKILGHLLKIAPHLTRVSFQSLLDRKNADILLPSKMHLLHLKNLSLTHRDLFYEGQEDLSNFVQAIQKPEGDFDLPLNRLCIYVQDWPDSWDGWNRGSLLLRTILESSKTRLDTILLDAGAGGIVNKIPGLPALPKVKRLQLDFAWDLFIGNVRNHIFDFLSAHDDFPRNCLSQLLPNVELAHLICWTWWNDAAAQKYFPQLYRSDDRLPGVKTLRAEMWHHNSSREELEGISQAFDLTMKLCPGITRFEGRWPYCGFPFLFQPLWTLPDLQSQLTNLLLEFRLDDVQVLDTFSHLDAAITGLSNETASALYERWKNGGKMEPENNENLEVNSSILNLPNLQNLQLQFTTDFDREPRVLISAVAVKFGFDLMKGLKVLVLLNLSEWPPQCPECTNRTGLIDQWFQLHKPLVCSSTLSNVTLDMTKMD